MSSRETSKSLLERAAWFRAWAKVSRDGNSELGLCLAYYIELIADLREDTRESPEPPPREAATDEPDP